MSIASIPRRLFWAKVDRAVKGFGRAFAVKKYGSDAVRHYLSNRRVR
jgi:hypothetical protein